MGIYQYIFLIVFLCIFFHALERKLLAVLDGLKGSSRDIAVIKEKVLDAFPESPVMPDYLWGSDTEDDKQE